MDILTADEHRKLDSLKQIFKNKDIEEFQTLSAEEVDNLKSRNRCVKNALEAFGSENFVVSCVGMLKAGKSTLVRLFARNELASPTGFGFDTTLRPALITYTKEDQGKIEIWLPNRPNDKLKKDVLDEVFLCLRNVKTAKEVSCATCHEYKLTPDNLENALCRNVLEAANNMLPCEPVMVVIKVPHEPNSLLSSEITILDTPGLDSGISEWTNESTERYSWIIDNSDLLLFLQSSVAPLNKNAAKILRDIHDKNPNTPVWLIQNEMIAKPWLPEARIHQDNDNQRLQASKMFDKIAKVFKKMNSNLGKADSAVFDDSLSDDLRKKLYTESTFQSMEDNIRQDLGNNIGPIRRKNCIQAVLRENNILYEQLDTLKKKLDSSCQLANSRIQELANFLNQASDFIFNQSIDRPWENKKSPFSEIENVTNIVFSTKIPVSLDKYLPELQNFYDNSSKDNKNRYSSSDISEKINQEKNELLDKIKQDIDQITISHFIIDDNNNNKIHNNIGQYLLQKFQDFIEQVLTSPQIKFGKQFDSAEANRVLKDSYKELRIPELPSRLDVTVDAIFAENFKVIPLSQHKSEKIMNCVFELCKRNVDEMKQVLGDYFDPTTKKGKFVELIGQVEAQMKANLLKWMNTTVFETLRDDFKTQLEKNIQNSIKQEKDQLDFYQRDLKQVDFCMQGCEKLKQEIGNF